MSELETNLLLNIFNTIDTDEYQVNIDKYHEYSKMSKKNTILLIQMILFNLTENSNKHELDIYLYKLLAHNSETYYNLVNCEIFCKLYKKLC